MVGEKPVQTPLLRRLVWTRGQGDWASDAALLASAFGRTSGETRTDVDSDVDADADADPASARSGSSAAAIAAVLHLPCLTMQAVQPSAQELAALAALTARAAAHYIVFTSAHAVDFSLQSPAVAASMATAARLYTHGEATAAALRARGLAAEIPAVIPPLRTAAEFGEWLQTALPPQAAAVLPGPKVSAYDLAAALGRRGFHAQTIICYETEAKARTATGVELTADQVSAYVTMLAGVICFASPSAVAGFAAVFRPGTNRLGAALQACVLGPTTASVARQHFRSVHLAPRNELAALVEAARELCINGGPTLR